MDSSVWRPEQVRLYPPTAPWPLWNISLSLSLCHISSFSPPLCVCVFPFIFLSFSFPLWSSFSFLFFFFLSPEGKKMNEFHSHLQIHSGNTKQQNNIFSIQLSVCVLSTSIFIIQTWRKISRCYMFIRISYKTDTITFCQHATDSSFSQNYITYRKWTYHCVLQMALHKCGGTVPLTIPLLKVSLSQLTMSFTRSTCTHANTHVRARTHTQISQLMGLNLINCSETDTLSLINPFLRLCAHGVTVTIQHTHKHTHTGGEREA